MKYNTYLMPYQCQLVGWGLLGAAVVYLLLYVSGYLGTILPYEWVGTEKSRFLTLILMVLFYSSVFLIALSREREEDEMIHELRSTSTAITAYMMIIIFVIMSLLCSFNVAFRFLPYSEVSALRLYSLRNLTTNVMSGFFLYLGIYKIRLWKRRWETRKSMKEGK